jgi:hypothetical protein
VTNALAAPRPEAAPNTSSAKAKPANKMGMLQSTAFSAWCLYNTRAQKAVDKGLGIKGQQS